MPKTGVFGDCVPVRRRLFIEEHDFLVSAASCYRIKGRAENVRTMRNLLVKIHPEGLTGAVIVS